MSTQNNKIVLVTTDTDFAQETKTAFASSDKIQLEIVSKNITELRGEIQEAESRHGHRRHGCLEP